LSIPRANCFIRKIVWRSRSRRITSDHCVGTVYAMMIEMIVSMTINAASVKPS
jgi:hypothetical protein